MDSIRVNELGLVKKQSKRFTIIIQEERTQ
jgi:hypothetical protein